MGEHHIYGPSTLDNLALCVRFKYDSEKNVDAGNEGTLLHAAFETGDLRGLSPEQVQDVTAIRDYVESIKHENGTKPEEWEDHREIKLVLKDLTHGRADCVLFHPKSGRLVVIDAKFTRVDAEHGMQLRAYAAAFIEFAEEPVTSVSMHIVAPRLGAPEIEEADPNVLLEAVRKWITELYARIEDPFTPPTPHVDVCGNCARAASCPALGNAIVRLSTGNGLPVPLSYDPTDTTSPRDMAIRQVLAGAAENWATQVKKANKEYVATTGQQIPYFKETTRSTGLRVPKEGVLTLASMLQEKYGTSVEELLSCSNVTVGDLIDTIAFNTGIAATEIKDWLRGECHGVVVEGTCSFLTKEKRISDTDLLKQLTV